LVPRRSTCLVLAVACSLALCAGAAMGNPDPAPVYSALFLPNNYGHVTSTFDSGTSTYFFTVFNDQTVVGQTIGGFAVYPTVLLNGSVPTFDGPPPSGWIAPHWSGPISGSVSGAGLDSFVTMSSISNIGPSSSKSGFSIQWIGANLPTGLKFGVQVVRPTGTLWAQVGPDPCVPVPDASTLVLAGSGVLMALPSLRWSRRRRTPA
jgi:hypothetical protein